MSGAETYLISLLEAAGIERTRAGASLEEEVTLLFAQLRAPLLRYLFTMGLPAQEGEEVAQEVFLALFRHLQAGRPRTNLKAWVFRAGHNLGLRARNRMHRNITFEEGEDHRDPAPNPEVQAAHSQRQRRLLAVVAALAPQDRACIHLRAEGLKYRDIAAVLGISLGSVAQSMERALKKLQRVEEV